MMSQSASELLVHIGPLRQESEALIQQLAMPSLVITPQPNSRLHEVLEAKLPSLRHSVASIAPQAGNATRHEYSLPAFNSLAPATGLTTLYPGLAEQRQRPVETQRISDVLAAQELEASRITHLLIEQPENALALLQAMEEAGQLETLTALWVRTSPLSLYEGMPSQQALTAWCEQQGFDVREHNADDPDFMLLGFHRHPLHHALQAERQNSTRLMTELEALKEQLEQAREGQKQTEKKLEDTHTWFMNRKQQAVECAEALEALKADQQALQQQLKESQEERDQYQRYFANRKKEHEATKVQLSEAQQALKEKDVTIARLTEQLGEAQKEKDASIVRLTEQLGEAQKEKDATFARLTEQLGEAQQSSQQAHDRFAQLESKLEQLFGDQHRYIQQTTNTLGQHVTRTARQQRDEQALAHYLQHGQRPANTALPPGFAMALLEQNATQRYDVVVVFGSSEATELLAHAVVNERSEQQRLTRQGANGQERREVVSPAEEDLPQSIISFEHQKTASNALQQRLKVRQSSQAVNVVYAPWSECHYQGQATLFYACDATLQRLNQWLPASAKVLVVVGEALPKVGHGRMAALPNLLQQLPTQQLDIILPHAAGDQEHTLQAEWQALLDERQREWQPLKLADALAWQIVG